MKNQKKRRRLRCVLAGLMLSCLIVDQVQGVTLYVRAEENTVQEKNSESEYQTPQEEQPEVTAPAAEPKASIEEAGTEAPKQEAPEIEIPNNISETDIPTVSPGTDVPAVTLKENSPAEKPQAAQGTAEPEDSTQGTPKETKPGDHSQDTPKETKPGEEKPQDLETGSLMLEKENWSAEAKTFTLNLSAVIPAGTAGNQIILKLPQYISMSTPPAVSDLMKEIQVNENGDGGKTVTMILSNMDSQKEIGLQIGILQEEFIKNAKPETNGQYMISAEYQNDKSQDVQAASELRITCSIDSMIVNDDVEVDQEKNVGAEIETEDKSEHLDLEILEAEKSILDQEVYIARTPSTKEYKITYKADPADPPQNMEFVSKDPSIVTVDENGVLKGIAPGETEVEVSYDLQDGNRVKENAKVRVEHNEKPDFAIPFEVHKNVGDYWEARHPDNIIVWDDHDDPVTLRNNIKVVSSVPVDSQEIRPDKDGIITGPAGTKYVQYTIVDTDGQFTMTSLQVRVHGLPKFKDLSGKTYDTQNMPPYYERLDNSLDPYRDVKVYWDESTVAPWARELLIDPADPSTGSLSLKNTVDSDGNPVTNLEKAGKYSGDYEAVTPKGGKTTAHRDVYIRGKVELTGNNIAIPATATQKRFDNLEDFLKVYGTRLDLKAGVDTPETDGSITHVDLSDKIVAKTDISQLDFSLAEGQDKKTVELVLQVTDKAENYSDKTVELTLYLTVQDVVGNAPEIKFPTASLDVIETDTIAAQGGIYQKLLDFADIYDIDKDGKPMDSGKGIKESGIKTIHKVDPNDLSDQAAIDVTDEAALEQMLKTIGMYRMVYYAVDEDNNYVQAEWMIHVAGKTYFVKKVEEGTPADSLVNFRQRKNGGFTPTGVLAYHIDSNGTVKHESPVVVVSETNPDLTEIGAFQATYGTTHHYEFYPGTHDPRPQDEFVQDILVHGPVTFEGAIEKESYFINETVELNTVTAGFMQAFKDKEPAWTKVNVTIDKGSTLTSDTPKIEKVTYQAEDTITKSDAGNQETLEKEIWFYGLPSITAPKSVRVKKNSTQEELKAFIQASAAIELPDGTKQDLTGRIEYDFSKVDQNAGGGEAELRVTYRLPGGEKRTDVETVSLEISQPPVITANDIEKNEGEPLDLLRDANVTVTDDFDQIDVSSIEVIGDVPVNKNGEAEGPGTYQVVLKAKDTQGGLASKEILIRVHGLPTIHGAPDLETRVGESLEVWDRISVTWKEAPDLPGEAVEKTFDYSSPAGDGSIELNNYRKMEADGSETPVHIDALNKPGYYKGDYVAVTPKGGKTTEAHTLLLHGKISLSAQSVNVSVNYTESAADPEKQFLKDYKDSLQISSEVIHAAKDGTTETINLLTEGKVSIDLSNVKFGVEGSYPAVVTAVDDLAAGIASSEAEQDIMVNIVKVDGNAPTVTTHDIKRVSTDGVKSSDDIMSYLMSSTFFEALKGDSDITESKITRILQSEGPDLSVTKKGRAVPQDIDSDGNGIYENQELLHMMQTVGTYEITYQVMDQKFNKVEAVAKLSVAGPTQFGLGETDAKFQELGDILECRQAPGEHFTLSGIRARHQDPDGTYHYEPVESSNPEVSLETVSVEEITIKSAHHYLTYEDGSPRPEDTKTFKILVQGRVQFKDFEDLTTFVGRNVDEAYQVEAFYKHIDETGTITDVSAAVTVDSEVETFQRGSFRAVLKATDDTSGAPNNSITETRTIYVNDVPTVDFNDNVSVSKDASREDILKKLDVSASYQNYLGEEIAVTGNDLEINLDGVNTSVPGKYHTVTVQVWYRDYDGMIRFVKVEGQVYVLNDPSAVVMIPAELELKDMDNLYAGVKEELRLYTAGDVQPDKIPEVEIYPDQRIVLTAGKDSYEAFTYYADGTKYEDAKAPIMKLKYRVPGKDRGSLYIKTEIDRKKPVNTYRGVMNFTIKYGGGQP